MLKVLALIGLSSLLACGSAPPLAEPLSEEEVNPGHTDRVYEARMFITVTGASSLGPETLDVELRVVEILGGRHPRETWFYSVSPNKPVIVSDGRFMLFSADLSPGIWTGPGRYELSDEAGVTLEGQAGVSSGAYVQLYRAANDPAADGPDAFARYDIFGAPCVLTTVPDDRTGQVDCPSLLDVDGNSVALRWNWERL